MMTNPITLEQFANGEYEISEKDESFIIDEEVNDGERSCIIVNSPFCCIPDFGIKMANGIFSYWNEEEQCWDGDFSLTIIYEIENEDPQNYIYWEQDGAEVTLYNWLNVMGKVNENNIKDVNELSKLQVFIS